MKESLLPLSKRLLVWGIAGVAFVTPLLLTTSTVDPFEFPKQTFLYAAVLVLLALWLARFFLQGEVRIRKTPLDLPLLLFLGVVIVSTVLSYNQVGLVGFFGFFGRFQGGMLSILAAVLLYYIAVSNLDEREDVARVIWAVVAAGTILAVIGLTNALGFPLLSFPEAQGRTFSLTGALSSMSVYLAATLLLIFGMLLRINQAKGPERSRGVVHEFRIRLPGTHRGRGRPKGMKNKNTLEKEALLQKEQPAAERQAEGPERSRRAETFWSEGQGKKDEGEKKEGATLLVMLSRFFNRGSETLKIRSLREDQVQGDRRRPTLWIPPAWVILVVSGSLIAGQLALLNHPAAWAVLIAGSVVLLFWNRPSVLLPSARFISIILSVGLVVFLSVHVVGLGKVVPQVQPLEKEHTLDMLSSWGVAALTVRDYPLFGSGPGTFLFDFTRYRPTSFNETQYWNLRFTAPHNEYFLYLTTFGIIGLFGFAVFVIRFVIFALGTALKGNEKENHPLKVSVIATAVGLFVGMAFTAYSTTPFVLLFLVLAVGMALERLLSGAWSEDLRISLSLAQAGVSDAVDPPSPSQTGLRRGREVMPTIFFYPGIALVVFAFYFLSRNIQANVAYTASLAAAGRNDGTATYNLQKRAIELNPFIDQYRLGFAQTNLLLANAIAGKQDPTEEDRNTIASLLDQAVREARTAAELAPLNVQNWEGLAAVYRSITGAVSNAGDWALQSYSQAMVADPENPQLRLDVGGLYYAAQQFDPAISQFQAAVQLKPSFANAWYNLANAFKQKQMYSEALQAYEQTSRLVIAGSDDASRLGIEMEEVRKLAQAKPTTPVPSPSPASAPGSSGEAKPSPSPSPSPSASPKPEVAGESTPSAE